MGCCSSSAASKLKKQVPFLYKLSLTFYWQNKQLQNIEAQTQAIEGQIDQQANSPTPLDPQPNNQSVLIE